MYNLLPLFLLFLNELIESKRKSGSKLYIGFLDIEKVIVIDREVKQVGLNKRKNNMDRKKTLEWFKEKEAPMYVKWYDGW